MSLQHFTKYRTPRSTYSATYNCSTLVHWVKKIIQTVEFRWKDSFKSKKELSFLKNVQSQWRSTQDAGMLYYPPQPQIPFFSVLMVFVGITYFSDSLQTQVQTYSWHASEYTVTWNYIVFLRGTGSTVSILPYVVSNRHSGSQTRTHAHTPWFSHQSSSVGHLWSFPLNIILTAAGTWLISCLLISSVWPSEKKKTTHYT